MVNPSGMGHRVGGTIPTIMPGGGAEAIMAGPAGGIMPGAIMPGAGAIIPGAIETLKELQARGHKIILYTQRNDNYYMYCPELVEYGKKHGKSFKDTVNLLEPAVRLLSDNGISPDAINENPWWESECQDYGRKVYFDVLIDDHNAGITRKTIKNSKGEWCEVVDWNALRDWLKKEGIL